ncbi:MAG: hypothetical protein V1772_01370, partial [Chloroflexota bacterium]
MSGWVRGRLLPLAEIALALAAGALWYGTGGAVWYRGGGVGLWPVLLVLALWPLHWVAAGVRIRPTASDGLVALWLASGAVGVWAAYDRGPAWAKLGLMLGAAGLYVALAHQPGQRALETALGVLALLGAGLAVYFVASTDWTSFPDKLPVLPRVGAAIAAALPRLGGHAITPNVAGGMLAGLAPLALALVGLRWRGPRRGLVVVWAACALVIALGWVLSTSRGAWGGLAGALLLWLAWRLTGRWAAARARTPAAAWRARLAAMGVL